MTIGERIKERREALGLTQTDLAIRMGYKSRAAICNVEKNKEDLTTTRIWKFAEALECSPAYLMGWQEQISKLQKSLEPLSEQMAAAAKHLSESLNLSNVDMSAYRNLEESVKEICASYDASEINQALKFTRAFLKATPDQQKIVLEILQLHREDS